jgi:signal transduction histidine kinase
VTTRPETSTTLAAVRALEVNYHALLSGSPDTVVLLEIDGGRLLDANANANALFGLDEATLRTRTLAGLCPPTQPDGTSSEDTVADYIRRVAGGEIRVLQITFANGKGGAVPCEMRLVKLPPPHENLMHARIVDITARVRGDALRKGQGRLLEMVALGAPLVETLDSLMLLIESQSDGVYCSVLLLDEDGKTIRTGAGPNMPPDYMALLDGFEIGPYTGSCGTAMFRKETVIVADIMNDPLWAPFTELVRPYGFRACWSTPIYLNREQILGTFAMYYKEVRSPVEDDMRLIGVATHLAGIAIERTRRERELTVYREHLEQLVDARTSELTVAVEQADKANHELAQALDYLRVAQDELVRRDKLAALGSLVAGIAHELNTPIGNSLVMSTTMADRAQKMADRVQAGLRRSELDTYLAESVTASDILTRNLQRAADLVSTFKQIGTDHDSAQRRRFSLSQLLGEIVPALRVSGKNMPISVELDAEPGLEMDSYPGPLTQVVTNLFDNCLVHAFEQGHKGSIRIGAHRISPDTIALSVADNGVGMPPAVAAKVYDPFFTTRLGSGGSGLGLHIAHNIVTGVLGGRIELVSNVGEGTTFTLIIPAVATDVAPVADKAAVTHA